MLTNNETLKVGYENIFLNIRQGTLLKEAMGLVNQAIKLSDNNMSTDILASTLASFIAALEEIIGEVPNQEIVNKMLKVLSKGFRIVVWPDTIQYKDINDMIVAGENLDHIYDTINENTFEGLQARLRINQWKRT